MPNYRNGVPREWQSPGVVPYEGTPARLQLDVTEQPVQLVPQAYVGSSQSGIDVRRDFSQFIEQYGHMVIIQRSNLNIHCFNCYSEEYGEPDPQCPYCLGRGFLSVFERHIARRMSSVSQHRQQILVQSQPGPEVIDEVFWYFNWDVNPGPEDMVYEVTWEDLAMLRPKAIVTAFRINYPYPYRGYAGRIDYWRAACSARPIDRQLNTEHLHRLMPQIMKIDDDGIIRYAQYNVPAGQ